MNIIEFVNQNYNEELELFLNEVLEFSKTLDKNDKIDFYKQLNYQLNYKKHRLIDQKNALFAENEKRSVRFEIKDVKKKINLINNILNDQIKQNKKRNKINLNSKKKDNIQSQAIEKQNYKLKKQKRKKKTKKDDKYHNVSKINNGIKYVVKKKYKSNEFVLPFSKIQIEGFDLRYNTDILNKINSLNSNSYKLEILMNIINECNNLLGKLYISKKEYQEKYPKDILCDLDEYQQLIIDTHAIKYLIRKTSLYYKKIDDDSIKKQNKDLIYEELILTEDQKVIENLIKKGLQLCDEIDDVIVALAHFLKNSNVIDEQKFDMYMDYININIDEYYELNNKLPPSLNYLIDVVSNKAIEFGKDTIERKVLKEYLKKLRYTSKIYTNDKEKPSSYFEVFDYLFHDNNSYLYLRELLKRNDRLCNIKYNDKHIVIYILDLYISNFKKMIKDKNSNYIDIDYLKEVYFLFTKNPSLRISEKDREEIDQKLKDLKRHINETIIKQKRKKMAFDDIRKMSTSKFYKKLSIYEFSEFGDDLLGYEKTVVLNNKDYYVKDKKYNEAFLFGNYAYSIEENDTIKITMYSPDYSSYIPRKSLFNQYLYKCEIKQEKVDEFTVNGLSLKLNETHPVIAYELEFYQNGKIKDLKVKKDIVKITDKYLNNINDEKPKFLYKLYKKSISKNGGEFISSDLYGLNDHFESLLIDLYIKFLRDNNLPYIYYGYSMQSNKDIDSNINNLSNHLFKMDKKDSSEIINILSNKIDINHYSNYPIRNGIYDLKLINSFNYLGIENQRMLNDLYFNQRKLIDPKRIYKLKLQYFNEYAKMIKELNENIDYIDPTIVKMNRGKMKLKIKI